VNISNGFACRDDAGVALVAFDDALDAFSSG
jgi:hypothetical protein